MKHDTDKIIDSKELEELVLYSPMQISRMEKMGTFPKRIRLGPKRVGWSENEVQAWIAERKRERDEALRISGLAGRENG